MENLKKPTLTIECEKCGKVTDAIEVSPFARYKCTECNTINEVLDFSIKEWLGFNYSDYMVAILSVVRKDNFTLLAAKNEADKLLGKLSKSQIEELKSALIYTFENGKSIKYLTNEIKQNVKPGDLKVLDEDGEVSYIIPESARNIMIARTESTRTANLGAEKYYDENDIKEYFWIASTNACEICGELNGKIFNIGSGDIPPEHPLCRCTIGAVTRFDKGKND